MLAQRPSDSSLTSHFPPGLGWLAQPPTSSIWEGIPTSPSRVPPLLPSGPDLDAILWPSSPLWKGSPPAACPLPRSPHRVEVVIGGHVVLVVTGQAQLVPVALVDEVPELLGAQRLQGTAERLDPPFLGTPLSTEALRSAGLPRGMRSQTPPSLAGQVESGSSMTIPPLPCPLLQISVSPLRTRLLAKPGNLTCSLNSGLHSKTDGPLNCLPPAPAGKAQH